MIIRMYSSRCRNNILGNHVSDRLHRIFFRRDIHYRSSIVSATLRFIAEECRRIPITINESGESRRELLTWNKFRPNIFKDLQLGLLIMLEDSLVLRAKSQKKLEICKNDNFWKFLQAHNKRTCLPKWLDHPK